MRTLTISLLIGLMACDEDKDTETTPEDTGGEETTEPLIDADADGYTEDEDCDDASSSINPGAAEICDGIDNNCDGQIDEGATTIFYADGDGDGYGDDGDSVEECEAPTGYITESGDCNDSDAAINPGAKEVCDYADNNCDEQIDEKLTVIGYVDADGDGFGADGTTYDLCEIVEGYSDVAGDCDDASATTYPGNAEICDGGLDNDCDKTTEDSGVGWTDGKTVLDLTTDFSSGTAKSAAEILLGDAGDVYICGGTYYVDVDINADVNLYGVGAPGDVVLDGAGSGTVVSWLSKAATSEVDNLVLTNGVGFYDSSFGRNIGGLIRCQSSAVVTLSNITLTAGDAGLGGGIFTDGCTLDFSDTEVYENTAEYGAGMFIYSGDVSFVDSQIWSNVADYTGGGAALEGYTAAASLTLTDTAVTDNEGYYGAGLSAIYDSSITITGTGKGKIAAEVTSNYNTSQVDDYNYGGGLLTYFAGYSGTVSVSNVNFGEEKLGDDNDPNDVYSFDYETEYTDYGANASFNCNYSSGCY